MFPWHEMVTVFTGAFIALHVALLAVDPYANVGVIGAFVPGYSAYRPVAVALGSIALYALIFTAVTAKWTRLLPSGWWLKVHRFAAVVFLLTWMHAVLSGTDGGASCPSTSSPASRSSPASAIAGGPRGPAPSAPRRRPGRTMSITRAAGRRRRHREDS